MILLQYMHAIGLWANLTLFNNHNCSVRLLSCTPVSGSPFRAVYLNKAEYRPSIVRGDYMSAWLDHQTGVSGWSNGYLFVGCISSQWRHALLVHRVDDCVLVGDIDHVHQRTLDTALHLRVSSVDAQLNERHRLYRQHNEHVILQRTTGRQTSSFSRDWFPFPNANLCSRKNTNIAQLILALTKRWPGWANMGSWIIL